VFSLIPLLLRARQSTECAHCTGDWVGPTAIPDAMEKGKISCHCQESNPVTLVVHPTTLSYHGAYSLYVCIFQYEPGDEGKFATNSSLILSPIQLMIKFISSTNSMLHSPLLLFSLIQSPVLPLRFVPTTGRVLLDYILSFSVTENLRFSWQYEDCFLLGCISVSRGQCYRHNKGTWAIQLTGEQMFRYMEMNDRNWAASGHNVDNILNSSLTPQ
jgi:hypothetical protein